MEALEKIASVLRDNCRVEPSATIVVGVSGGADSLCLMHALHAIGHRVIAAHFNHRLRPEAEAEARDVEAVAGQLAIPCVVESADVRSHAKQERLSIEEAGRNLRYAFLFAQGRAHHAAAVAVGHTADDQAETVLMHLVRGAGMNGLRGMPYRTTLGSFDASIPLVRPLLDLWREDTVAYCASHGLRPHHDPSNDSSEFLRNRVRHELIPTLEKYNPRIREILWRMANIVASDYDLIAEHVRLAWDRLVQRQGEGYVALNAPLLSQSSEGLQRHLVRLAAERLRPGEETSHSVLQRAADFIHDNSCQRLVLGNRLKMLREGGLIYVCSDEQLLPSDVWPQIPANTFSIPVSIPGRIELSDGWEFTSGAPFPIGSAGTEIRLKDDPFAVWLDAENLPPIMELRPRRRGDRFVPLGMRGRSQKLSDFLVNAKLPARARNRWPLLCSGEIVVWVPGYRPAERFKLGPDSRKAVCFSISRTA